MPFYCNIFPILDHCVYERMRERFADFVAADWWQGSPKPKYVLKMGDRKWHNKWSLCQNFWWSYWQSFYCVLVWRVQACSLYHVSYIIDQSESSHSCCYSIGTNCIDFKNKILDKYSHYYPNFNCKYVLEIFVPHFVFFFLE